MLPSSITASVAIPSPYPFRHGGELSTPFPARALNVQVFMHVAGSPAATGLRTLFPILSSYAKSYSFMQRPARVGVPLVAA